MLAWLVPLTVILSAAGACALMLLVESRRPRVICLMYHRFADRDVCHRLHGTERVYTLPIEDFEAQLRHLHAAGYTFLAPAEVREFVAGERTPPQPAVLITIDDGCLSVLEKALPALKRHQAKATVFVTTDLDSYVFSLGAAGDRRMTDDELRTADGDVLHVESHAVTHRPLRGLSDDEIARELGDSRRELQRILARPIEYLAIPGNWYDRRVMELARREGYRAVWCSKPGGVRSGADPFGLRRINIEGTLDLDGFTAALTPWGLTQRRIVFAVKSLPARILGPKLWLPIRAVVMRCLPGGHVTFARWRAVLLVLLLIGVAATLVVRFR